MRAGAGDVSRFLRAIISVMISDPIAYLLSLPNEHRSMRYDIRNMQVLASSLGDPHKSFRSVLVAGTNGKGSVARLLAAMVAGSGLYTSPHLVRLNERIRIGSREISRAALQSAFDRVVAAARAAPNLAYPATYFELVTAMAFCHFRGRVSHAVLEVGLGGRLDATNVVSQDASVVTNIGLDHQQVLGTTAEDIAREKSGIIKGDEPVIVGPSADRPSVRARAAGRLISTRDVRSIERSLGNGYFELRVETGMATYPKLRPRLAGRHQLDNVMVAICTAEALFRCSWPISKERVEKAINETTWPGRLETFPGRPSFLVDGAHNVPAAEAVRQFLEEFCPAGVWLIFGAMREKDIPGMIGVLGPVAKQIILTRAANPRAADPEEFKGLVPGAIIAPDVRAAIRSARQHAPPDSTVLVAGSLYLAGEARMALGHNRRRSSWAQHAAAKKLR